jgi:hypothetical protein
MPLSTSVNRITSKDVRLYFTPYATAAQSLVFDLYIDPTVTSGNFYLRINGVQSSAISLSAFDGAADDDARAALIDTALTGIAIPLVGNSGLYTTLTDDITVVDHATKTGYYTVTMAGALADKCVVARIDPVSASYDTADYRLEVTTHGSERIRFDAEAMSVDFQQTTETTDATALSEFHDIVLAIRQNMSGSIGLYHAQQSFRFIFGSDVLEGRMELYGSGEGAGKEGLVVDALWEDYSETYPDHEKVEISVSWVRQGEPIMRIGDLQ